MKRLPSVAGYFYPQDKKDLLRMIERMTNKEQKKEKALCAVSPHAGYEYSGAVAGAVYSSVILPNQLILLGPSHRDIGSRFALMREGDWETPMGTVPVNTHLADLILSQSHIVEENSPAHTHEHSLEVQLPFIQYFNQDVSIVPISISFDADFKDLNELAQAIKQSIAGAAEDVLIVASTDMSHYVSKEVAKKKDFMAIDKILKIDPKGLYNVVRSENISMCGYQPTTAALIAVKELGATKADLIKYQTSGDITGDTREVVGYAGIRIL